MIKTMKTMCPWCHRQVHAILSYGVWQGECSVCNDSFVMSIGETKRNQEGGVNNE